MEKYADEKRWAASSNIKRGDQVLLKQERKNKLSTRYDPDSYTVVGTKGTSLLLKRRDRPEIMTKLPPDNENDTGAHPQEARGEPDREPDQAVETTAEPRPQRSRKPPGYLGFE